MNRLKWLPLIVCLMLAVFLGSAVLYGRTLPTTPSQGFGATGLDVCRGKFCLFHVTPGVTTFQQAKTALASNITRDEGDHFHGQVGAAQIRVEMDSTGSQTRAIEVQGSYTTPNTLSLHFSQIVEQFGMPCYIASVGTYQASLVLVYPGFNVEVAADQDHISLESPISAITLVNDGNLDAANKSCRRVEGVVPWLGFASLERYQSLELNQQIGPYD